MRGAGASAKVQPGQPWDALGEPAHVLHLARADELEPAHGLRAERAQVREEHVVARCAAEADALERLERPHHPGGGGGAGEDRACELPPGVELAKAGECAWRELERARGAEAEVEMEDFERGVGGEEGGEGVEPRVGCAVERGEGEVPEGGPAAGEEEVVRDRLEEARLGTKSISDTEGL